MSSAACRGRFEATARVFVCASLLVSLLVTVSCSDRSSSGGGASASASGTASSGATAVGALHHKALEFHRAMQTRGYIQDGLVFNVRRDAAGNVAGLDSEGDSCIWTGLYVAAEAERYAVTRDPDALANMERSLWALHTLQDITDVDGYLCRFFGRPPLINGQEPGVGAYAGLQWNRNSTMSRDQYTGWMLGVGLAWPHIQDPALRANLQRDCRLIAEHLMRTDLRLVVPRNGVDVVHFNLNPDKFIDHISPQDWAQVDDFPLNLITSAIPYDPVLAAAIVNADYPPLRSGEALRALLFFKVAAMVTGDPVIESYYRNELLGRKDFLAVVSRYGTLIDDVFSGQNLQAVEDLLLSLGRVVGDVLGAWVRSRTGSFGGLAGSLAASLLQPIIDSIARSVGRRIADAIRWLQSPTNRQNAAAWAGRLTALGTVLSALGMNAAGQRIQAMSGQTGAYLNSSLEDARRALLSGVGLNLTYSALYGLLALETDPNLRVVYEDVLQRRRDYDRWMPNSYFQLIHSSYSSHGPDLGAVDEAIDSLERHFEASDSGDRLVDNSGLPGVVVSPWPDRFGRVGNHAIDPFPLDRRSPHHWIWQQHPCTIRSGSNSAAEERSGGGFLLPYWLGRRAGLIDPAR